ncbi:MAG: helix-turn-helix domain-containing protein, partial [Hungatella sp.]
DIDKILTTTFSSSSLDLETAKNLALSTYLWLNSPEDITTVDTACDFFRKVYSCNNTHAIYELLRVLSFQKSPQTAQPNRSNVGLLKTYVSQHLDEENLSLKWLAENYLFVNVRYLSKQFVKEEGERFSDYLNRQRMEEAKKLLILYNNDNIKDIAKQIGFGNNPRYFSQVFKRYTGYTPSTFLEEIQSKR